MSIGKRVVEAAYVFCFYSLIAYFVVPSKSEALVISMGIGLLVIVALAIIIAIGLIWVSVVKWKGKYGHR
jgi:NADH:ubiquinone oxidoreductase subunit H